MTPWGFTSQPPWKARAASTRRARAAGAIVHERNWYLPSWLSWLPDLQVEGHQSPAPRSDQPGHGDAAPEVPPVAVPVGS
jgi:hypothetical protein